MSTAIRDVDSPVGADGNTVRLQEVSLPPLVDKIAIRGEDLNTPVAAVGDVDETAVEGYVVRVVEPAGAIAPPAPGSDEVALDVEDLQPMVAPVNDVDPLAAGGDPFGQEELSGCRRSVPDIYQFVVLGGGLSYGYCGSGTGDHNGENYCAEDNA